MKNKTLEWQVVVLDLEAKQLYSKRTFDTAFTAVRAAIDEREELTKLEMDNEDLSYEVYLELIDEHANIFSEIEILYKYNFGDVLSEIAEAFKSLLDYPSSAAISELEGVTITF